MSRFSQLHSRVGAPGLVHQLGVSSTYADSAGGSASFDVVLGREKQDRRKDQSGWSLVTTRTARYITADVEETIRLDGTLTTESKEYSIEHIATVGVMTELSLIRVEAGEVTRPSYRGR